MHAKNHETDSTHAISKHEAEIVQPGEEETAIRTLFFISGASRQSRFHEEPSTPCNCSGGKL